MLWVVYNVETTQIYQKCYTKKSAKEYVARELRWESWITRKAVEDRKILLEKVDIRRLDEWRMWKTLQTS